MHLVSRMMGCLILLIAARAPLHGGGVTLITHGARASVNEWILPMCERIAFHPGLASTNISLYQLTISDSLTFSCAFVSGVAPLGSDSGEIVVAVDWSSKSGVIFGAPSAADIAVPVANALLSTTLIPELGGRSLAQLPLHLAGHSRGGIVMAEVAKLLGAQGVWVDNLTLMDPYANGFNGDPSLKNYANVFFTENYRQANNFPTGNTVAGAYDRLLTTLTSGGYAPESEHSDVHLWYHGTIDFRNGVAIDGALITAAERTNWWATAEKEGTNAGFVYSLLGGGNRFLTNNPGGASGRIADGVNKVWDFGAGLGANRTALPQNNGSWPNAIRFFLTGNTVAYGGPIGAAIYYQHGLLTTDTATLTVCLDTDSNPWNTNHVEVGATLLLGTGTGGASSTAVSFDAVPGLAPGEYPVFARVTYGGRTRFLYAAEPVIVAPALTNPRVESGEFAFTLNGKVGWRVVIEQSGGLSTWTPVATNVMTAAAQEILRPVSPSRQFFRAVLR